MSDIESFVMKIQQKFMSRMRDLRVFFVVRAKEKRYVLLKWLCPHSLYMSVSEGVGRPVVLMNCGGKIKKKQDQRRQGWAAFEERKTYDFYSSMDVAVTDVNSVAMYAHGFEIRSTSELDVLCYLEHSLVSGGSNGYPGEMPQFVEGINWDAEQWNYEEDKFDELIKKKLNQPTMRPEIMDLGQPLKKLQLED